MNKTYLFISTAIILATVAIPSLSFAEKNDGSSTKVQVSVKNSFASDGGQFKICIVNDDDEDECKEHVIGDTGKVEKLTTGKVFKIDKDFVGDNSYIVVTAEFKNLDGKTKGFAYKKINDPLDDGKLKVTIKLDGKHKKHKN